MYSKTKTSRGNTMTNTKENYPLQSKPDLTEETTYQLLEARYGGGFAQWFVDELRKKRA